MSMKIVIQSIIFLMVTSLLNGCGDKEDKPSVATIAVLAHTDFVPDRTQIADRAQIGLPEALSERMLEHLTNSKRFVPVDRTALRRTVLEQRFGQNIASTYLDQTLDKAITNMTRVEHGGSVSGVKGALSPKPVGSGIATGTGTIGTTGALADYNDILKDFQDLGTTVGADYLVLGNLEKLSSNVQVAPVPYSQEGRVQSNEKVDARLNLRIIDSKNGTIIGATAIRTHVSYSVFSGQQSDDDEFSFYDHLGRLAAVKVLDMIYPARIVSTEPLVISRGKNDGVSLDDIYKIEREGRSIKDESGQEIARLKQKITLVQVTDVQDTVAVVKPLKPVELHKGDLATLDTEAAENRPQPAQAAINALGGSNVVSQQRPTLAVVLIKKGSTETPEDNGIEQHTPMFTDTIISRLTQSKRFEVLDRQEVDQLLSEQTLIALRNDNDLASAVGTLKGSDYLIYGSLADLTIDSEEIRLPGSSQTFNKKIGYLEGNMRIVDARSGQVMESRKISVKQKLDTGADEGRINVALADAYAEQVVLMLMNKLYPIRIAAIGSDNTIYINRGEDGGLFNGEVLDAYRLGNAVIDPETGVQLGQEEMALGQVQVNQVEDARSKGAALGNIALAQGDLLKRSMNNQGRNGAASNSVDGLPTTTGTAIIDRGDPNRSAKPDGRQITLVVGQLKVSQSARSNNLLTPERVRKMTNDLVFKLTHSNRFKVLERQEVDQLLDEKKFDAIVSGGDIDDRIKQLIAADYLVHGDIENFYINTKTESIPYLDEQRTTAEAIAEGVFRIVDVHSGAVMAGDRLRVNLKVNNVDNSEAVESQLQDTFSTKAVAEILLRLFPIKVLGVAGDGVIFLNRGEDAGLQTGEIFEVMKPGEALIDPDTGRSFGSSETKVASVQLTAVEPARSRAKLTSGEPVQKGYILRKTQQVPESNQPDTFTPNW